MDKVYDSIVEYYKDKHQTADVWVFTLRHCISLPSGEPISSVSIVNADTLDTALAAPNTLLLNMANPTSPGGCPRLTGAQEEDLFRRTNLHRSLQLSLYPLHNKLVLCKHVEVIRKGIREGYAPLEAPRYVDILSCSAVQNLGIGRFLKPSDARIMRQKIWTIFEVAKTCKYERLVLSAFGCGGFRCPPEHVSAIFRDVAYAFRGDFKEIVFAIWDESYPCSNYAVFKKTLEAC